MSLQTSSPLPVLSSDKDRRRAHGIAMELDEMGGVDLNPSYQRSSVWSEEQRVNLIRSLIMDLPVPSIVLANRLDWSDGETAFVNAVVDGKQRIETLQKWFSGDLEVPATWFPAEDYEESLVTMREDGPWLTFNCLTRPARTSMKAHFTIQVAEVKTSSLQQEAQMFLLLNSSGSAQTSEDLERAQAVARG